MKFQVVKRDGSIEDFNQGKIARVVTAAGLNDDQAETLAAKIAKWVEDTKLSPLTSLKIRNKVVEELRQVDQYAANLFENL